MVDLEEKLECMLEDFFEEGKYWCNAHVFAAQPIKCPYLNKNSFLYIPDMKNPKGNTGKTYYGCENVGEKK